MSDGRQAWARWPLLALVAGCGASAQSADTVAPADVAVDVSQSATASAAIHEIFTEGLGGGPLGLDDRPDVQGAHVHAGAWVGDELGHGAMAALPGSLSAPTVTERWSFADGLSVHSRQTTYRAEPPLADAALLSLPAEQWTVADEVPASAICGDGEGMQRVAWATETHGSREVCVGYGQTDPYHAARSVYYVVTERTPMARLDWEAAIAAHVIEPHPITRELAGPWAFAASCVEAVTASQDVTGGAVNLHLWGRCPRAVIAELEAWCRGLAFARWTLEDGEVLTCEGQRPADAMQVYGGYFDGELGVGFDF